MKISEEQLQKLQQAQHLLADVQVEIALAEDRAKSQAGQWRPLYSIRCRLGEEVERLKQK